MKRPPQFIDDPEKREERLRNAVKAKDRYGNTLYKIGRYWCSDNTDRFAQLADELKSDEFIIVCRVCDGRYFGRGKQSVKMKAAWRRRLSTRWYLFVDPEIQEVY